MVAAETTLVTLQSFKDVSFSTMSSASGCFCYTFLYYIILSFQKGLEKINMLKQAKQWYVSFFWQIL